MQMLLNNCHWELKGYWPYIPLFKKGMELGNTMMPVTDSIEATVPGGVHADLLRAGIIEAPFFETNSLKCEWVENRWWVYETTFRIDPELTDKNLHLIFKGLDYKSHIFLNNSLLGVHENMFTWAEFNITELAKKESENSLVVILENAPEEMSQIGITSMTRTQKSRFNYKWDFCTRMVNIGIWDDVIIKAVGDVSFYNTCVRTDIEGKDGVVNIDTELLGEEGEYLIHVNLSLGEQNVYNSYFDFYSKKGKNKFECSIRVDSPALWQPNGLGEQPLYDLKIEALSGGKISDCYSQMTGIRKLEYKKNEKSSENSIPYTVMINSRPVYIKGVNLTPFGLLYGNVNHNVYDRYIRLIKNANINLVRIWGGGIIEKEYFYKLCDENGIMVWQDFIQSSSGMENEPSTDSHFINLLTESSEHAIKSRSNHVCHTIWCGGNELYGTSGNKSFPISKDHPNIKILESLVNKYDKGKLFLPASPSGPNINMDIENPLNNHDVHGEWVYGGIKEHYRKYNKSSCLLQSEFGVAGIGSLECLKSFLSESNLTVSNMEDNLVWRHHGEWWDTFKRDKDIFGTITTLKQFSKYSQFIQADGLRYIIEANRRNKFHNSGSIIWQLNEPWPNVSCTSLVDYCAIPKMAYYWVKDSFSSVHASLRHGGLQQLPENIFSAEVFLHNSLCGKKLKLKAQLLDVHGQKLFEKEEKIEAILSSTMKIMELSTKLSKLPRNLFFARLQVWDENGIELTNNVYTFSQLKNKIFSPMSEEWNNTPSFNIDSDECLIENTGSEVCLYIHRNKHNKDELICDDYFTLFPSEQVRIKIPRDLENQNETSIDSVKGWDWINRE